MAGDSRWRRPSPAPAQLRTSAWVVVPLVALIGAGILAGGPGFVPAAEPDLDAPEGNPSSPAPEPGAAGVAIGPRGPLLLSHSPWIEARGVPHDAASISLRFAQPLDPASVSEHTVRVGLRYSKRGFEPVPARVTLEDDGRTIRVHPSQPLLDGIYHHVNLEGGPEGVRTLDGQPLVEGYRWRFATALAFTGSTTRASDPCARPGTGGTPGDRTVVVHVYQTSCNAPLVPEKPALVRVYAPWELDPTVYIHDQLPHTEVHVEFTDSEGALATDASHIFYRPDLPIYKSFAVAGTNTANAFWRAAAGQGEGWVQADVEATDGSPLRFSPGRFSHTWREWKPARDSIHVSFVDFTFMGTGPIPRSDFVDMLVQAVRVKDFALQTLPIRTLGFKNEGSIEIGTASEPSRSAIRSETGTKAPCNSGGGCSSYTETFPVWDHLDANGNVVATLDQNGNPEKKEPYIELLTLMQTDARIMGWAPRASDVVVGFVPSRFNPMTAVALNWKNLILAPVDGETHVLLHEILHFLGLSHCPFAGCECYCGGYCRQDACVVEGFRLKQESTGGWNKSEQEGNAQSSHLGPLLYYSIGHPDPQTGLSQSGTRATTAERFTSQGSYSEMLDSFTVATQSAPDAEPEAPAGMAPGPDLLDRAWAACAPEVSGTPSPIHPDPLGTRPAATSRSWRFTERFGEGRPVFVQTPALIVSGIVRPDGSHARILRAWIAQDSVQTPPSGQEIVPGLSIATLDASGAAVESRPLTVVEFEPSHAFNTPDDPRPFIALLPVAGELSGVAITGPGGAVLDRYDRSPSAPTVNLVRPGAGDVLSSGDEIAWEGSDPDGDMVVFRIEVRAGADGAWTRVAITRENAVSIEDTSLRNGSDLELRVVASDGFNTSSTPPVAIQVRRPPRAEAVLPDPDEGMDPRPGIQIAFDTEMDPASLGQPTLSLVDEAGAAVAAEVVVSRDGRLAVLQPSAPLRPSETYTIRLSSGARDIYGTAIDEERSWTFRTKEDIIPPFVTESIPAPGAYTVDPGATVTIRFTEPLDPSTIDPFTIRIQDAEGTSVPGTLSWDDATNSVVFEPASPFPLRAVIRVTVDGVADRAGNVLDPPVEFPFNVAGEVRPAHEPQGVAAT